ncbi:SDR family oxidoreductase [Mycobacterium tuberculosis]|uniref:SDR family oxidoreductase n=1 Tax=Mycobacterium tuberculosis TaxID=1773 RepID=UPI00096A720A|nr:SDR family oxidoreductase [Mycobacterium tuberculosis]
MARQRFRDQVVLITGASSGIGEATAKAFAREGAVVALAARREGALRRVAREIEAAGGRAMVAPLDVSSSESVRAMVADVVGEFGRIDVVFNNAGVSLVGPVDAETFLDDTREMLEIDYLGTVRVVREVLPIMKQQRSGRIMNMSSVVGRKAFARFAGYSSAMHAIAGFSDALRQELRGSGIAVSVIHPALTQTPLLANVDPADMPPPFCSLTPIPVHWVAAAVLDGVARRRARVVVPFQPRLLMVGDAFSPRYGDRVVRLLESKIFGRLIGSYRGSVYRHQPTESAKAQAAQPERGYSSAR